VGKGRGGKRREGERKGGGLKITSAAFERSDTSTEGGEEERGKKKSDNRPTVTAKKGAKRKKRGKRNDRALDSSSCIDAARRIGERGREKRQFRTEEKREGGKFEVQRHMANSRRKGKEEKGRRVKITTIFLNG